MRKRLPVPDPNVAWIDDVARRTRLKDYADGVLDGFEIALGLLLGDPAATGGIPFRGPVSPGLERWARAALDRVKAEKEQRRQ